MNHKCVGEDAANDIKLPREGLNSLDLAPQFGPLLAGGGLYGATFGVFSRGPPEVGRTEARDRA
ncbi:MAG: hypothetical protein WCL32_18715, partial [Planctomycetota bacterium]